jgi:hypothetical protein
MKMPSMTRAKPPSLVKVALTLAAAMSFSVTFAACFSELPDASNCKGIPENGCIATAGIDVCAADPSCRALYSCVSGAWQQRALCTQTPRDAAADTGRDSAACLPGSESADGGESDAQPSDACAPRPDAAAVPPGGYGFGCDPPQAPDCVAGTAVLCPSGCCGCEDLFVCKAGVLELWGTCQNGTISRREARIRQ